MENAQDFFGPVISSYTGEQALKDGILFDVTDKAKEAGFNWPVRITTHLKHTCTPPKRSNQDFNGRLWDVLYLAAIRCKSAGQDETGPLAYQLKIGREVHKLWITIDGTNGYPAIHIMHPEDY